MRFLLRRALFPQVTAWAAFTINVLIPRLMPGNPVEAVLVRSQGQLSVRATKALEKVVDFPVTKIASCTLGVPTSEPCSLTSACVGLSVIEPADQPLAGLSWSATWMHVTVTACTTRAERQMSLTVAPFADNFARDLTDILYSYLGVRLPGRRNLKRVACII